MYILTNENKEVIETGNLKKLIPNCTNPTLLSVEELKALNVYKAVEIYPPEINKWESYDLDFDFVFNEEKQIFEKIVGIKERVDLEQFKKEKIREIKGTYIDILREGYFDEEFNIRIDCEKTNVSDFSMGLQLMKETNTTGTKVIDYDNNTHNYSKEDYTTLVVKLGQYFMKQLYTKNEYKTLINSKNSFEEVNDIYWRKPVYDKDGMNIIEYIFSELI